MGTGKIDWKIVVNQELWNQFTRDINLDSKSNNTL